MKKASNARRAWRRWRWFQIKVRSSSSRRQVCTHRSVIEFILGIRTPVSTTWVARAARNLVMDLEDVGCRARWLIRDRDGKYPALRIARWTYENIKRLGGILNEYEHAA